MIGYILMSDFREFFQIFKIIILRYDFFFSNSYIFAGQSGGKKCKYKKVIVSYELINQI